MIKQKRCLNLVPWLCFVFLLSMVFGMSMLFSNKDVSAVRRSDMGLDGYYQVDIAFVDNGECEDEDSIIASTQKCTLPTGDQITWIGDSLTALGGQGRLEEYFPGVDFGASFNGTSVDDYVRSGKRVDVDNGSGGAGGLEILEHIVGQGKLRPFLVFALGANSPWNACSYSGGSCIDKLMELAGDSQVIVLTTKVIPPHAAANGGYDANNEYLKEAAGRFSNLTIADWANEAEDEYFGEDGLHYTDAGYDAYLQFIKDSLPSNCSAGLLPGDSNEEIVWNYFVQANIDGVSDNPAVISGIIGNLMNEALSNPFCSSNGSGCNSGDTYHGIYAESNAGLKEAVDAAGLGEYWGKDPSEVPPEASKKAIEVELDYLTQTNSRWLGDNSWVSGFAFMKHLDDVDDTSSPESYADLFMVAVEGCYPGGSDAIMDSKVKQLAVNTGWTDDAWQLAARRRASAREVYDKYAGVGAAASNSSTGFSTTSTLGGTANEKYDATPGQVEQIAQFAVYMQGQTDVNYKTVVSNILDNYESSEGAQKGNTDKLLEFMDDSDDFIYKDQYHLFRDNMSGLTTDTTQLEGVESVLKEGVRTTSTNKVEVTNGQQRSITANCEASSNNNGDSKTTKGNDLIAKTAALMAWPVQDWQTMADDYSASRVGQCYGGTGNGWIGYEYNVGPCMTNPRDLYKQAWDTLYSRVVGMADIYEDCGFYVSSVLHYLGVADDAITNQPGMYDAMTANPDWSHVGNGLPEESLKPGDVLWTSGHVRIYVGSKYGGSWGNIAHASRLTRVGEISQETNFGGMDVFRYVGDKLGSSCEGESGGEAIACAAEYLAWPIEDIDKAYAGILTEEYKEARDKWFGPNSGDRSGGNDNDVSCARFASLAILESGADPGFAVSQSPSPSNIKWLGGGLEGYLASSPNWEDVTGKGEYQRGDIFLDNQPHVWINLGGGLIAEGAANSGNNGINRSGAVMQSYGSPVKVYRVKD